MGTRRLADLTINDADYWRMERLLLGQSFSELAMRVLLSGAESGAKQLAPMGLDVLVDWDVFNESATEWMRLFIGGDPTARAGFTEGAFAWADRVTETTRQRVMREIDNWVREGEQLSVLEARLTPIFGERRASMIATTEVTRIYASGNLMAWQASGAVQGKRWMTAVTDVCPICQPLHNTIVSLDGQWTFSQAMLAANPELAKVVNSANAASLTAPPAHVNCRCIILPVVIEAIAPDELVNRFFENVQTEIVAKRQRERAPLLLGVEAITELMRAE